MANNSCFYFLLLLCLLNSLPVQACTNGQSCGCGQEEILPSKAAISLQTLLSLIRAKVPLVIIDCREGLEMDDGKRIPGAKLLSPGSVSEKIAKLVPDRNTLIITYDDSKEDTRRKAVTEELIKLGYANIIDFPEGISNWIAAGNEIEIDSSIKSAVGGRKE